MALMKKIQLTTKSSDHQSDREHTQQQVNHLFLHHLIRCSYRYMYACVHTQLHVNTHSPQTVGMESQKWDRKHHFPQSA